MRRYFKNSDVHTRTWNHLMRLDGRTLELAPGEEVELDINDSPDDPFEDMYLKPVDKPKGATKTTEPADEADEEKE